MSRPNRKQNLPLKRVFDAVPPRYDLLNRLLTLRQDERWRRAAAMRCLATEPARVLDLCCGTGDLALQIGRMACHEIEIIGWDYSEEMLHVARAKEARASLKGRIRFVVGDAANLAFRDSFFDAVGIAFAFRNLTWRNPLSKKALMEVYRTLKPKGRFVIVETSQPDAGLLRNGFHAYMSGIVAPLGGWVSGNPAAYRYLSESACNFCTFEEVSGMLEDVGFRDIEVERLMGGVAAIHTARKAAC